MTAIGFLETSSIAKGIEASDAMCKMAEVSLAKTAVIPRGKYIVLVTGKVGEVQSAMRAGLDIAGKTAVHHFILPNVHPQVLGALDKRVSVDKLEAVGIIETVEAAPSVHAADAGPRYSGVRRAVSLGSCPRQSRRSEDDVGDRLDAPVAVPEGDDQPQRRSVSWRDPLVGHEPRKHHLRMAELRQ